MSRGLHLAEATWDQTNSTVLGPISSSPNLTTHLKGLPRTGRTAPLKINPQLALIIFIRPFSHPKPQYQNQRCVRFGFQAAQVQQKTIQKLEKICRNKKADDELIMYDLKVF